MPSSHIASVAVSIVSAESQLSVINPHRSAAEAGQVATSSYSRPIDACLSGKEEVRTQSGFGPMSVARRGWRPRAAPDPLASARSSDPWVLAGRKASRQHPLAGSAEGRDREAKPSDHVNPTQEKGSAALIRERSHREPVKPARVLGDDGGDAGVPGGIGDALARPRSTRAAVAALTAGCRAGARRSHTSVITGTGSGSGSGT